MGPVSFWIMLLFKTLKYRREVGDGILDRPLSLHQRPLDEQAPTSLQGRKRKPTVVS